MARCSQPAASLLLLESGLRRLQHDTHTRSGKSLLTPFAHHADTLRENQASSGGAAEAATLLKQSRDAITQLWDHTGARARSSGGGAA